MELTYGAQLPVPTEEAFAFVSRPENWPHYLGSVESAESMQGWGTPGGRARMTTRLLGRRFVSDAELVEWAPPRRFRYVARQAGRPDLDNLRVFEESAGGCRFTGTTVVQPRGGIAGLSDRVYLRLVRRMYDRAMRGLPDAIVRRPSQDP